MSMSELGTFSPHFSAALFCLKEQVSSGEAGECPDDQTYQS
jgi:hypothetical protein